MGNTYTTDGYDVTLTGTGMEVTGILNAADSGYLNVIDDPTVLFEIQEDSGSANLAITDVGQAFDLIVANANTVTGVSVMELDSSAEQDMIQVMSLVQREDNARWRASRGRSSR